MTQPIAVLPQVMAGFAPLASGLQPTTVTGMENMPLIHNFGPLGMVAQPAMRGLMGSAGFAPFGMHDVNVYDQIRDLQYSQAQAAAMAQAATRDRENFFRTIRGMAAMTGTQFGAQQRRAAYGLADTATYAAPMLAQMNPDMLEAFGGMRGSSTVMAQRMMQAGRYRVDPVTGRIGMSADSVGALAGSVYDDLYGDDYRRMHGLTAGQAGALFGELNLRGLVGSADGSARSRALESMEHMQRHAPEQLQRAFERQRVQHPGDLGKLSGKELDTLMLDSSIAGRMRGMDADKVKRSLESFSSAVSAMRDIFGDMGRPNAPMPELMKGLEALTAGSSAWMDPSRLAAVARQTYNLSKQTGLTVDAAVVLQQHAASRAEQMGLPPIFAVQAAQGGMAFGGAYRASGQAAHTAWGVFNAEQMTQADINLRVQAAGSHMANRLGAVARLAEARGGFDEGSEAANLFRAIKTGQSSFRSGNAMRSVVMGDRELFRILGAAGVSENTALEFIDQAGANRELIDRYGIGNVIRREQGRAEVQPFVRDQLAVSLVGSLTESGVSAGLARQAVGAAAGRISDRMFAMGTAEFASTSSRTQGLARILGEELDGTAAGDALRRMRPDQRETFLRTAASQMYGHAGKVLATSPYAGLGGLQNIHRLTNQETLAQADLQQQEASFTSRMQEAMSPLGKGSPLARAMQFLQDTKPGDNNQFKSMVATAFGGVRATDVQSALLDPLRGLHEKRQSLLDLRTRLTRATDGAEKDDLNRQIDRAMGELGSQAAQLARIGETYGYYADASVSKQDTARGIGATRAVIDSVQDLASIRGSFSTRASPTELAEIKGAANLSHEEAAAVLLARRHADAQWSQVTDKDVADFRAARSHQGVFFASDEQAKQNLLAERRRQISMMDPEEVEAARATLRAETDEEARAVAMVRRQLVSPRASDEQVEEFRKQGLSEPMARWAADQEQRAKRFGISDSRIEGVIAEYREGKKADGTVIQKRDISRAHAITDLIADQVVSQYTITDEDMRMAEARKDLEGKTPEQRRAIILDERIRDKEQRFRTFFSTQDAAVFRSSVDAAGQFSEDIATKLTTPAMIQRFGTQALDWNKELRLIQRRQQELAYLHAGGDMAKLEAGFFSGINTRTAEGQHKELAVMQELADLRQRQMDIFSAVDATHGKEGRQFRVGTMEEGVELLFSKPEEFAGNDNQRAVLEKHKKWLRAGKPQSPTFTVDGETVTYTQQEYDEVYMPMRRNAQERVGDREEARRLLDLPAKNLTVDQQAALEKATYDVSVMRRLPPQVADQLARFRDDSQSLDNAARRYGVSRDELEKFGRGEAEVRRLDVSSPEAIERHERANLAYRRAAQKKQAASERIGHLQGQIDRLVGPEHADARNALRRQQDAARAEVSSATDAMTDATRMIAGDAVGKGVEALPYLLDRVGLVSEGEAEHIRSSVRSFDERKREADVLATSHGLRSAGDFAGYADMAAEYEKRRRAATQADTGSGADLVRQIDKAYGLGLDPATMASDSKVQRAASLLVGTEGRRLIGGLVESQNFLRATAGKQKAAVADRLATLENEGKGDSAEARRLRGYADKFAAGENAGIDLMIGAYGEANKKFGDEKVAALKQFRTDFGFAATDEGDLAFRGFAQAAEMQSRTKFDKLGEGRGLNIEHLFDLLRNVQMGGESKEGARAPERMEISGTLRLTGDTAEVNARTGGSMYAV